MLLNENREYLSNDENARSRVKASAWFTRLKWRMTTHLRGLNKGPLTSQQIELINQFAIHLVKHITGVLMDHKLLIPYKNILSNDSDTNTKIDFKTVNSFAWAGSDLLTLPKTLILQCSYPPND